ncbi:MAG: phnA protein [Verrucomicrobiota bacterium]
MARGWQANQERLEALKRLGKELARRARSKCELCEKGGLSLSIFEVSPVPKEPEVDRCLMLCEACRSASENPEKIVAGENWRFLTESAWSELPAVQVVSVRLLKHLAGSQAWAKGALEELFLDDEIEEWVTEGG